MGMAASQGRLLALTSRNHTIGLELEHLSLDKMSLTREMQNVSKRYQNALSQKVLKWSNNSGVTHIDISYDALMKPSAANQNKPYLITDGSGKIVVDKKYQKYAEMISPEGKSNGDYESNRIAILSELTGIPTSKFEDFNNKFDSTNASVDALYAARNKTADARKKAFKTLSEDDFVKKWGKAGIIDFTSKKPKNFGMMEIGNGISEAKTNLKKVLNEIEENMTPYLVEKDVEALHNALTNVYENIYAGDLDAINQNGGNKLNGIVEKDGDIFKINVSSLIAEICGAFMSGSSSVSQTDSGTYRFEIIGGEGVNDDNYKAYLAAKAEEEAAEAAYKDAVNKENQVFTADEETQVAFYDLLFNAIAEKGWSLDSQIDDNDYLNNMLQNNLYTITTIEENSNYDDEEKYDSSKKNKFNYTTDIASNFDKIFMVNDEDSREQALVEYEAEKYRISAKEKRIDQRMKNLETEQSAINQMIQGIEQVRNDNSERFFSIFS